VALATRLLAKTWRAIGAPAEPLAQWHDISIDPTLGDAIPDRIIHDAHRTGPADRPPARANQGQALRVAAKRLPSSEIRDIGTRFLLIYYALYHFQVRVTFRGYARCRGSPPQAWGARRRWI
jgi:hypothetical protein